MADHYSLAVNENGAPNRRSNPNIQANRAAQGVYRVNFPEDIDQWVWLATLGSLVDANQNPGSITVQLETMGVKDNLVVKTFGNGGAVDAPTDRPFHLFIRRSRP